MIEKISALVDGALDSEEVMQIIASMQTNKQAAEAWHHYHLIGDAMRNTTQLSPNFKQNLMQQLALEPTVLAPGTVHTKIQKNDSPKTALPMRWAIAASVAAITVVGWMALQIQTEPLQNISPIAKRADNNTTITALVSAKPAKSPEIPSDYLTAHQSFAPSASAYYVQTASYTE